MGTKARSHQAILEQLKETSDEELYASLTNYSEVLLNFVRGDNDLMEVFSEDFILNAFYVLENRKTPQVLPFAIFILDRFDKADFLISDTLTTSVWQCITEFGKNEISKAYVKILDFLENNSAFDLKLGVIAKRSEP